MRIIAYTKYGREAASTRQRVLQYRPALAAAGIEIEHLGLLSDDYVRSLATGEHWSRLAVLRSYAKRLFDVLSKRDADLIWVYAELFPYLPAAIEKLILRQGVPIVYDYDDAFFLSYNKGSNPIARAILSGKLEALMERSAAVICGNEYLREHAARHCPNSIVVPTVVDTEIYRPGPPRSDERLTIGWIGSPSTWANVRPILPVLKRICADRGARVRVIGAGFHAERDRFPGMELANWSEDSEVADVQGFDIGIAPLVDAPFQRGKSGYKLIQYMACGIPAVSSSVGANSSILTPATGLFADSPDEWERALRKLIDDPELRKRMGNAGRECVIESYSLKSQAPRLIDLFREIAPSSRTAEAGIRSRRGGKRVTKVITPRPMNLLFVIKSLTVPGGGAERVLATVTGELAKRGHRVIVASFDPRGSKPFYKFDPGVELLTFGIGDTRSRSRVSEVAARMSRIRRLTRELRPDVAVGFMHSAYVPLGMALLGTQTPVVASEHIVYEHYLERPLQRFLLNIAGPSLHSISAISEPMLRGFPAHLRDKMRIIGNPVEQAKEVADVIGGEIKTILSVGRLESQKDQATLIAAFARIADRFPDWRLRILGEGNLRPNLEQQIADLGLSGRIDLPGAVTGIGEEYCSAQLFVLPSRYESFGLATGEAMGHGLPVIGFADCPGTNEIIRDAIDGLLVASDRRVENLADAMARLMASPDERTRMGKGALSSPALPSAKAVVLEWEKLLRETADR